MINKKSVLRKIFFVAKRICGLRLDNNIQLLFATNKFRESKRKGNNCNDSQMCVRLLRFHPKLPNNSDDEGQIKAFLKLQEIIFAMLWSHHMCRFYPESVKVISCR